MILSDIFEPREYEFRAVEELCKNVKTGLPEMVKGFRLFVKGVETQFGEVFQARCRTPEWRSALIVWAKYKKKYNFDHEHLVQLREYAVAFVEGKKAQGKAVNKDFLTQECSAEAKRIGEKIKLTA